MADNPRSRRSLPAFAYIEDQEDAAVRDGSSNSRGHSSLLVIALVPMHLGKLNANASYAISSSRRDPPQACLQRSDESTSRSLCCSRLGATRIGTADIHELQSPAHIFPLALQHQSITIFASRGQEKRTAGRASIALFLPRKEGGGREQTQKGIPHRHSPKPSSLLESSSPRGLFPSGPHPGQGCIKVNSDGWRGGARLSSARRSSMYAIS